MMCVVVPKGDFDVAMDPKGLWDVLEDDDDDEEKEEHRVLTETVVVVER